MTEEEKLYVKEVDCPEIQNGWNPKVGDKYYNKGLNENFTVFESTLSFIPTLIDKENPEMWQNYYIFLPSLDQLLNILGERFSHLALYKKVYRCVLNGKVVALRDLIYNGSTRKLACLLAVKEVLKEDAQEERDLVMQTRPFVKRALKKEESDG